MTPKAISLLTAIVAIGPSAVFAQSSTLSFDQAQDQLTLHLSMEGVRLTSYQGVLPLSDQFKELSIDGLSQLSRVGAPKLPFKGLLLKTSERGLKGSVDLGGKRSLGKVAVAPEAKWPCRCGDEGVLEFSLDKKAYANSEDEALQVRYLGDFRGEHIYLAQLRPFAYRDGELIAYSDVKAEFFGSDVETFNFETSANYPDSTVVLVPRAMESGLTAWADYRRDQGGDVEIHYLEDVGQSASAIAEFFHTRYAESQFGRALIVGDERMTPTHYVDTSSSAQTPSDLANFTMGGANDQIPDVLYGRIAAHSAGELARQLSKSLSYENRQLVPRLLGIASDEGYNPSDEEYMRLMSAPLEEALGLKGKMVFQAQQNSTVATIDAAFESGLSWVNYIGHGSGDAWVSVRERYYTSNDVKAISNTKDFPVIIDVACQNGRFNNEGRLGETFMAHQVGNKPAGAVAYYGGSVDISWHPPAVMAVGVADAYAGGELTLLGEVLMAGQYHLLTQYSETEDALENLRWYHLLGDPGLVLSK
jgi:hypothetical protein